MFNFIKKYLLIVMFLGLAPSIFAMENSQEYRWPLNALTGLWSKLPSIPSKLGKWQIRKETKVEKPKNNEQNNKQVIPNNLEPEPSEIEEGTLPAQNIPIASGGLEKISKKANAEIINIVEIALKKNGQLEKEDCKKIEECLLHGADPNLKIGPDNTPLLLLVAKYGKKYLFNYLLKLSADKNAHDKNGCTSSDIKKANKELLERIEIIFKNNGKKEKDWKKVEECLERGVNPNRKFFSEKVPLLSIAAKYKKEDLFNYLLELGADRNARDKNGWTPNDVTKVNDILLETIKNILKNRGKKEEDWSKIEDCLLYGADPNTIFGPDNTPLLSLAAKYKKEDLFNYLLRLGADDRVHDKYWWTPKSVKISNKILLVTLESFENGRFTMINNCNFEKEIIECIVHGADPNTKVGPEQMPLLLIAIKNKLPDLVNCLLEHDADPNLYDKKTGNTLHVVLDRNNWWNKGKLDEVALKIFENLLQHNADPNANIPLFNTTPLSLAIDYDDDNAIKLLIKYGADINQRDHSGHTYLGSILYGFFQLDKKIKKICNAGASLTDVDLYGNTVFHAMLSYRRHKETFETVLIYARPKGNVELSNTIKTFLLVFNRLNNDPNSKLKLPHDIQILILSKLLSANCYHRGLWEESLKIEGPKQLEMHITWLNKILQTKNKKEKTASQLLFETHKNDQNYINAIGPLLDGTQINKDYNALIKNPKLLNPDHLTQNPEIKKEAEKNLAWQIAKK